MAWPPTLAHSGASAFLTPGLLPQGAPHSLRAQRGALSGKPVFAAGSWPLHYHRGGHLAGSAHQFSDILLYWVALHISKCEKIRIFNLQHVHSRPYSCMYNIYSSYSMSNFLEAVHSSWTCPQVPLEYAALKEHSIACMIFLL